MINTVGIYNECFDFCACVIMAVLVISRLTKGYQLSFERRGSMVLTLLDVDLFLASFLELTRSMMLNNAAFNLSAAIEAVGLLQRIAYISLSYLFFLFAYFLVHEDQPDGKKWLLISFPYIFIAAELIIPYSRDKIYQLIGNSYYLRGPWQWHLYLYSIIYMAGAVVIVWKNRQKLQKEKQQKKRFWWILSFELVYLVTIFLRVSFEYLQINYFMLAISLMTLTILLNDYDLDSWRTQSLIDELSGIKNRQAFRRDFGQFIGHDLCVAMIDVDNFKEFNDESGHETGDKVIETIGRNGLIQFGGEFYRYGGDEFIVVSQMKRQDFVAKLNLLAQDVKKADVGSRPITLTIGYYFGHPRTPSEVRKLFHLADANLYFGKSRGRDQIIGEKP